MQLLWVGMFFFVFFLGNIQFNISTQKYSSIKQSALKPAKTPLINTTEKRMKKEMLAQLIGIQNKIIK